MREVVAVVLLYHQTTKVSFVPRHPHSVAPSSERSPLSLDQPESVDLEVGPDERVHLRHVAVDPEEPADGGGHDEAALGDAAVVRLGHEPGHHGAHQQPEGRDGQEGDEVDAHAEMFRLLR